MTTPQLRHVPKQSEPDASSADLTTRIAALQRFLHAVGEHLPAERLARARDTVTRAGQRRTLPQGYTVVALAGPTGGGKSSLFNALAGQDLSPVGAHRPTTNDPYACVWGNTEAAADLLDWLKVPPAHRATRRGPDQADLSGMVLLDLPDFDSLDTGHAAEVKRLLNLADVAIWVLDPQKYADNVVHQQHLPGYRHHREVTVVALNQADLLSAADLQRLLADLTQLLASDGLDGVFTIATSAVDAPRGLAQLRSRLAELVGDHAAAQRIVADVQLAVAELVDLVDTPAADEFVDSATLRELADGLARVAGVTAVAEAVETSVRRRGSAMTGWPPLRWLTRLRPDPLRRLHAAGEQTDLDDPLPAAAAPGVDAAADGGAPGRDLGQQAAAGLVVRVVANRASAGLPDPWPDAVAAAARSRLDVLPATLDEAAANAHRAATRTPVWWRLAASAQWAAAAVALAGLGWLTIGAFLRDAGTPAVAGLPMPAVLAGGGLLIGAAIAALAQPVLRREARLARQRALEQQRAAVATAGRDHVLAPVSEVLHAYARAREALVVARGQP